MESVWKPAVARVHEEVADMQAIADKEARDHDRAVGLPLLRREGAQGQVRPRQNLVTPYLQLDKMREAMFYTAGELFGLSFEPRRGVPSCRRTRRVRGDATRRQARRPVVLRRLRAAGQALGRVDERVPRAGALRREITTIVSNNTNFVKGSRASRC
jgi:peptidyl-dipeptidase Dcp